MPRKSFPRWLYQGVLTGLTMSLMIGTLAPAQAAAPSTQLLNEVIEKLSNDHLNGTSKTDLISGAIEGAIEKLDDPYTEYFTDEEMQAFDDAIEQSYVGVGARLEEQIGKKYVIVELFEGSPGKAAGLMPNDQILAVDNQSVANLSIDEMISKIKGPENTKVKIRVLRDGKSLDFTITRKKVSSPAVFSRSFGQIGYIGLTTFSSEAGKQFSSALSTLERNQLKGLVIDVRDNGGGLLDVANQIASNFIEKGALIYARDRNNNKEPYLIENGKTRDYPVIVLVNGNSASCSEVLAAALRDYQVAKLLGTKTYGKGSVQEIVDLRNGGFLKQSVLEYLTPKQAKVNKVGVSPDHTVLGETAQVLSALHLLGAKELKLEFVSSNVAKINGFEFGERTILFDKNNPSYVKASMVAALGGAKFASDNGKVTFLPLDGTKSYEVPANAVKKLNDSIYVDVNVIQSKWKKIKAKKVNGLYQLTKP